MPDPMDVMRRRRRTVIVVLTVLAIFVLIGIALSLIPGISSKDDLCGSLLLLALFTAAAMGCLPAWRHRRWRIVVVFGVIAAIAAFICCMLIVWTNRGYYYYLWEKFALILVTASLLITYICLTTLVRLRGAWRTAVWLTRAAALGLALWIALIIVYNLRERVAMPVMIPLILLTGCGTVAMIALHWLLAASPDTAVTTPLVLTLTCPRCGLSQQMAAGRAKCDGCGLTLRIEIEEEICPKCGYSLYRLTSDRCPECGAMVFDALVKAISATSLAVSAAPDPGLSMER